MYLFPFVLPNDHHIIKVGMLNAYYLSIIWFVVVQQITQESAVSFLHQKGVILGCSFISTLANLFLNTKKVVKGCLSLVLVSAAALIQLYSCTGDWICLTAEDASPCADTKHGGQTGELGKEDLSLAVVFQSSTRWSWLGNHTLTVAASLVFLFRP